jgi:hypothetical protein
MISPNRKFALFVEVLWASDPNDPYWKVDGKLTKFGFRRGVLPDDLKGCKSLIFAAWRLCIHFGYLPRE